MGILKIFSGLEFNDDGVVNNEIKLVKSAAFSSIKNRDPHLPLKSDSLAIKFYT